MFKNNNEADKEIICPHCNFVHDNWQDFVEFEELIQTFELDCDNCKNWFNVEVDFTPKFKTTFLAEDLIDEDQ